MITAKITLATFTLNCFLMWGGIFERGSAYDGVDPVILLFAVYGLSHIEAVMLRLMWLLHAWIEHNLESAQRRPEPR